MIRCVYPGVGCTRQPRVVVHANERYCRPHAWMVAGKLIGDHVKERDNHTCQRCSGPGTDWAHIVGRGQRYVRLMPDNAVTLCRSCHDWFGEHPAAFELWMEERSPGLMTSMRALEAAGERSGSEVELGAVIRQVRSGAAMAFTAADGEAYRGGDW